MATVLAKHAECNVLSCQELHNEFLNDDVQRHSPHLNLINPHYDPKLANKFESKKGSLDYLHNPIRHSVIQFVGSHWWHSEGLYRLADREFAQGATCPFDSRIERLKLTEKFQFSNCAMGYIPKCVSANMPFKKDQILYLRPKKFKEYRAMGTRVVFTLGQTVLDFHLYGTGIKFDKYVDAVKHGRLILPDGLNVVPMPHPGALGIMNYLRGVRKTTLDKKAQDGALRDLVDAALSDLSKIGLV